MKIRGWVYLTKGVFMRKGARALTRSIQLRLGRDLMTTDPLPTVRIFQFFLFLIKEIIDPQQKISSQCIFICSIRLYVKFF